MLHIMYMVIELDTKLLSELATNVMLFIRYYILVNSFLMCTIECGTCIDIHHELLPGLVSGGYTWALFNHYKSSGKTVVSHLDISDIYHFTTASAVIKQWCLAVAVQWFTARPLCLI